MSSVQTESLVVKPPTKQEEIVKTEEQPRIDSQKGGLFFDYPAGIDVLK